MSIPKKGSRRVHLHDKAYRYVFNCYGGEEPHVSLFIQEDCDEPGNVLQVNLDSVLIESGALPDVRNFPNIDMGSLGLGPGDIVELIGLSRIAGWEPSKKGPAVKFDREFILTRKGRT